MLGLVILIFAALAGGYLLAGDNKPSNSPSVNGEPKARYSAISDVSIPRLFELTNKERAEVGLPALVQSVALQQSATDKCNDMVTQNYFAHDNPQGIPPHAFVDKYTSYTTTGENLAFYHTGASSEKVLEDWMYSPSHKSNIVNTDYTDVNFAICYNPSYQGEPTVFIVQHFISEYNPPVTQHTQMGTHIPVPDYSPPKTTYCNSYSLGNNTRTTCE